MIVYLPLALFVLGGVVAYGGSGRRRQAATLTMILATAWALAFLAQPKTAIWGAGPVLASIVVGRPRERLASTFEVLTRRTFTVAGLAVVALFLAAQLPVGENPLGLNVVPWLLAAIGAAWVFSPIDAAERRQGQVLLLAGLGAVILAAQPAGVVTAGAAGAMAIMPVAGQRRPARLSSLILALALLAAVVSSAGIVTPRQNIGDLTLGFSGPVLFGCALVLAAPALAGPRGLEWTGLLGALGLVALQPALRWTAIAALTAIATWNNDQGERAAWLSLASFAAIPVLRGLAPPGLSLRFETVALGLGIVLALYAARLPLLRTAVLPALSFIALSAAMNLGGGNLTRLQWIAASGAMLFVLQAILVRLGHSKPPVASVGEPLLKALLLLAITARDPLGLGALATALLLIDLALVRSSAEEAPARSRSRALRLLGSSNWPPSVTFAGVTLTLIAALQASLALGLFAALLLAARQLSPLLDGIQAEAGGQRPRSVLSWVSPLISIASGVAPVVVLRMLRL